MRLFCLIFLSAATLTFAGCQGSRWARRDADYAHKYAKHTDSVPRMVKQAVDARHLRGKGGGYIAFAGRDDPTALGAEVGMSQYGEPWYETRVGLATLVHDGGDHPFSAGLTGSLRAQTPTRLAPFVGVGAYGGYSAFSRADGDGRDNDKDGQIDEDGELDSGIALAIYPEAGVHYWLNHRLRLTASASYYVTNQGRDDDFLFYSVGLAFLGSDYEETRSAPPEDRSSNFLWSFVPFSRRERIVPPELWVPESIGAVEGAEVGGERGEARMAESPYGGLRFE